MPIYELKCETCGQTFEERQSLDEHAKGLPACPRCGAAGRVSQLLSTFHARTPRKS